MLTLRSIGAVKTCPLPKKIKNPTLKRRCLVDFTASVRAAPYQPVLLKAIIKGIGTARRLGAPRNHGRRPGGPSLPKPRSALPAPQQPSRICRVKSDELPSYEPKNALAAHCWN